MFVEKSLTHKGSLQGFTMVELLMVITTVGIISIVALPKFLDFRKEARVATSQNYINHLRSALTTKKTQMMLYCRQGSEVWPRKEAIELNDITEAGAPEAHCSPAQVPNGEDRKFFAQSNIVAATNPYNLRNDIQYTTCTDFCTCEDAGGYLYNQQTGVIGHPLIMNECTGRLPAGLLAQAGGGSSGGGGSESSSGGSSEGASLSSESSSSECTTSYAMNEEFNLCEDVGCGGFVPLEQCESSSSSDEQQCGTGFAYSDAYNKCVCVDPAYTLSTLQLAWGAGCTCDANIDNCDGSGETGWNTGGSNYEECVSALGPCPYENNEESSSSEESSSGDVFGCTDGAANNYNSEATSDDGSCTYDEGGGGEEISGCTDGAANNYNSQATSDDGSCTYDEGGGGEVYGCTDGAASNYNSAANVDDGSCSYDVGGCMLNGYDNYNPAATYDDGSCICSTADPVWYLNAGGTCYPRYDGCGHNVEGPAVDMCFCDGSCSE